MSDILTDGPGADSRARAPVFSSNPAVATLIYCIAFVAINSVTRSHNLEGAGISLWSPDDGLSVLLLLRSWHFWPVVLLVSSVTDIYVNHVGQSAPIVFLVNATGTLVYVAIAASLKRANFDPSDESASHVVALLAIAPLGAAASASLASGELVMTGALRPDQFWSAARSYWIGDAVGMIAIIPGVTSVVAIAREPERSQRGLSGAFAAVFVTGIIYAITMLLVVSRDSRELLYLLFLPIIWVAITYGYRASAMAVMVAQLSLVANVYQANVPTEEFHGLQVFMLILAATGLLLGGVASERAAANSALQRQRRALERSSAQASLGVAAASIAHELSQPLASVAAYVNAARRYYRGGDVKDSEAVDRALAGAESEAGRARTILARVRDFVSGGPLQRDVIELAEVAQQICTLNRAEAERRGVELEFRPWTGRRAPTISGDRVMIQQALNNLVVNAIDAASGPAPREGRVSVELSLEDDQVGFDVVDDGPGVDPAVAESLFEAFETTKPQGMGLGLSLASQIMRKHDGRLSWRPASPSGARFSMRFPVHGE